MIVSKFLYRIKESFSNIKNLKFACYMKNWNSRVNTNYTLYYKNEDRLIENALLSCEYQVD